MYLRSPHISSDAIAFVADDDLWLAPADGGRAWRLTSDRGRPITPRFSPDGRHVAWTGDRDGAQEVLVASVADGTIRRLTHLGGLTLILGWDDDDHILFACNAGAHEMRELNVHRVDLSGTVERLDIGAAGGLARHEKGAVALSTFNPRGPAWWKRYRGGTASRLWLQREGEWERLLRDEAAALVDPMWIGDTLCFVSDRGDAWPGAATDQANIWALDVLAGETTPRQITHHGVDDGYVRDATTDGTRIIYSCRGELFVLDALDAAPRRLSIELPGIDTPTERLDPKKDLSSVIPVGRGHLSLLTTRGRVFRLPHADGPARAVLADSGVRAQFAQPLGNDGAVVMVTDIDGDDGLCIVDADGNREVFATGRLGTVLHLQAAPDGTHVATISHDGWVRIHDVTAKTSRDIHRAEQGEATGLCFSPDSRHLVWSEPTAGEELFNQLMTCLVVADADGTVTALTSGRFADTSPAFTTDGQHLAFLSNRTFEPVYDAHSFDLNFASATRPWIVPLRATDPAPFGPSVDGRSQPQDSGDDPEPVETIDAEGFEQRMVPLPVPSGDYRDLAATPKGLVWIHEKSDRGTLAARIAGTETKDFDILEHFTFATAALDVLVDRVDDYWISQDHERIVVAADGNLTARPSTRRVDKDEAPDVDTIALDTVSFTIDLRAEWRQMFDENARLMKRHYWREDMDGVDWDAVCARYRPLVEQVLTHDDLVDLLWETVGELNTSHAYVMSTTPLGGTAPKLAHLGADLSPVDGGWRIDRILATESSDPNARSPLMGPGVAAKPGEIIREVNGQTCIPPLRPDALLAGLAGKAVEVTIDGAEGRRRVAVLPVESEEDLRYHDWVTTRRERVTERSNGRVGYLHVPDMQARGWAQLHRDLQHATAHEAVILDVRYNRGGHTSQLVLERLARKPIAWNVARHLRDVDPYPDMAPRGPVVLVANQYSGSDGDIVNANAQQMGLGPVVGVRTWGGVVGIDGRYVLVDGTRVTQPRYSFVFNDRGWVVEGHGVDPDIEVEHAPGDTLADRDHQLDRAVDEALAGLARTPAATPPPMEGPRA